MSKLNKGLRLTITGAAAIATGVATAALTEKGVAIALPVVARVYRSPKLYLGTRGAVVGHIAQAVPDLGFRSFDAGSMDVPKIADNAVGEETHIRGQENLDPQLSTQIANWKKTQIKNALRGKATSLKALLEASNTPFVFIEIPLVKAVKDGNVEAFRYLLNWVEQQIEKHSFIQEYTRRSSYNIAESDESHLTDEALDELYRVRQQKIIGYLSRYFGVDEFVFMANQAALEVVDSQEDRREAKNASPPDQEKLSSATEEIVISIVEFFRNAKLAETKRMVKIFLHAMNIDQPTLMAVLERLALFCDEEFQKIPPEIDGGEPAVTEDESSEDSTEITFDPEGALETLQEFKKYLETVAL